MGWWFTHDVEEYAAVAAPLLAADPARHTISLTVIENARARRRPLEPPELYGWWVSPVGAPAGAVSHTPPFPLLLGVAPDETIRPLVEELLAARQPLVAWIDEFSRETSGIRLDPREVAVERLRYGGLTLWQDEQGTPVSLAGRTRAAAGVVRVGPVYTPPDQRRRGWAGAVTAAVSQAALDDGAREVVLFTDLANPTSNLLYQRLGYRSVTDHLVLRFES